MKKIIEMPLILIGLITQLARNEDLPDRVVYNSRPHWIIENIAIQVYIASQIMLPKIDHKRSRIKISKKAAPYLQKFDITSKHPKISYKNW